MQQEAMIFEEAKKKLMKKYGMDAAKAEQAITAGLRKLSTGGKVLSIKDVASMDHDQVIEFRNRARSTLDLTRRAKARNGDRVERAPRRNKFI